LEFFTNFTYLSVEKMKFRQTVDEWDCLGHGVKQDGAGEEVQKKYKILN
jgi:hypothetical protein